MKHLTRDELRALLTVAKAHSERDHLMILTGFWHGLRCSEIVKMRGTQIQDGHMTVQRLKGSLKTTQPLVSNADPLLDEKTAMEQRAQPVLACDTEACSRGRHSCPQTQTARSKTHLRNDVHQGRHRTCEAVPRSQKHRQHGCLSLCG